jgi:hypothetical protein
MNYIIGCDALIVSFIETMLTITAGLIPLSKRFRSPVELLLIFVNLTVVAFFIMVFSVRYTKSLHVRF